MAEEEERDKAGNLFDTKITTIYIDKIKNIRRVYKNEDKVVICITDINFHSRLFKS